MVNEKDTLSVQIDEEVFGGKTYWVQHPRWPGEERAICYRPLKLKNGHEPGSRCSRIAGFGTEHYGTGACKFHGGNTHKNPRTMTTGAYSAQKIVLRDKIEEFMEKDSQDLFDLRPELVTLRVLFQQAIDIFPDLNDAKAFNIATGRLTNMINSIGILVDRISKIESRNTITAAQVLYLRAAVSRIFVKFIIDPEMRMRALEELSMAIPGGNNDGEFGKLLEQNTSSNGQNHNH